MANNSEGCDGKDGEKDKKIVERFKYLRLYTNVLFKFFGFAVDKLKISEKNYFFRNFYYIIMNFSENICDTS